MSISKNTYILLHHVHAKNIDLGKRMLLLTFQISSLFKPQGHFWPTAIQAMNMVLDCTILYTILGFFDLPETMPGPSLRMLKHHLSNYSSIGS